MRSSFSRSFYPFALLLLAALILVGFFFLQLAERFLQKQTEQNLINDSTAIAQVAGAYLDEDGLADADFMINLAVASEVAQADVVICDKQGTLLMCSHAPLGCEHQGLHLTNGDFLETVKSQPHVVFGGLMEGLYTDRRLSVATAIRNPKTETMVGLVIISLPDSRAMLVLNELTNHYLMVSVLVVLVAVVILSLFARRNSSPLRDMAKTAIAFGHGDLKARAHVPKKAPDEIRELALAFNNMAGSLEKSEQQRRDFVANISHELKTPMTTISGYVDGILDGTIPPEQQEKYLQIVSGETKRLSRLVRSMLDISQLQDGAIPEDKMSRFDIIECAGQVLITFEQKILDKKLDVQVDFPEFEVYTYACRDYITQVIYNLVDNAVKFCPEGGVLGMRLCVGGNKLYFTVANDGQTIPAEELPLVFERFHKVDKSRSQNRDSWGLGLYIVKTIVCGHGEDISVSSAKGRTEFTFTLPLVN